MRGWFGNKQAHSLASKGIKTAKPNFDMRRRYLANTFDGFTALSLNPIEYEKYLIANDLLEQDKISKNEYDSLIENMGRIVDLNNRFLDYIGEDNDDARFGLVMFYIDNNMIEKAKESIRILKDRGFNISIYKQRYGVDIDD